MAADYISIAPILYFFNCLYNSENSKNDYVTLTPNPSSGIINLQFDTNAKEKIPLCIKNSIGQTVKIINVNTENLKQGVTQIDLREMPQGIYILIITLNNNLVNKKIIIAK